MKEVRKIEGRRKKREDYQKSSLYVIQQDEKIEYIDESGDSATVSYHIGDGQQGLYAHEFRPTQVPKEGAKSIDLSMGIEDYQNKKCIWGLYDLKKSLGGKEMALELGEQWQAALRYWYNSVLNYLDDYSKEGKIGVVTTKYEKEKVNNHIRTLEKAIAEVEQLKGTLIGAKRAADLPRLKRELIFFNNFLQQKFLYQDPDGNKEIWDIDVIISEHHTFEWKILN